MKKNLKILGIIVAIVLGILLFIFLKTKIANTEKTKEVNPYLNSKIESKTFENKEIGQKGTWGYDVSIDGNVYVHQPTIPAIGGNKGFKTQQDAEKTAELVVNKIKNNVLPPSVNPTELKGLGIE